MAADWAGERSIQAVHRAFNRLKQQALLLRYVVTAGCRYTWQTLKNCIKSLLGRKAFHDPRLEFFRQYFLHLTRRRPIWAITFDANPAHAAIEGPCSQAFLAMSTMAFARASGLTYLHSPFSSLRHADRPMPEWVAGWEKVFNLGAGETPCNGRRAGVVNNSYTLEDLDLCFGWRERRAELDDCFKAMIPEFRCKYYANKTPRAARNLTVALHIRRHDVSVGKNIHMYTSNAKILQIANGVKSMLDARQVPFDLKIYGQGKIGDFPELSSLAAEFFLGADPIWTLEEMVEADVLIVAKSCFSYYAGLISDGIKIFEPCGRPRLNNVFTAPYEWMFFRDLDGWLACDEDGAIDRAAFENRIALLLDGRNTAEPDNP